MDVTVVIESKYSLANDDLKLMSAWVFKIEISSCFLDVGSSPTLYEPNSVFVGVNVHI